MPYLLQRTLVGAVVVAATLAIGYLVGGQAGGALILAILFLAVYNNLIGPVTTGVVAGRGTGAAALSLLLVLAAIIGLAFVGWSVGVDGIVGWLGAAGYEVRSVSGMIVAGLVLGAILGLVGGGLNRLFGWESK